MENVKAFGNTLEGVIDDMKKTNMRDVACLNRKLAEGQGKRVDKIPDSVLTYLEDLSFTKDGSLKPTSLTLDTILRHDEDWAKGFIYNSRTKTVMFNKRFPIQHDENDGMKMDPDTDMHRMTVWFGKNYGVEPAKEKLGDAIYAISNEKKFDPVQDYLNALEWDGTERLERWLILLAGVEDTPINRAYSKCWLISAVARAMQPGCKADTMLVLMGAQGTGKSTLFEILAGSEHFTDHMSDFKDKDSKLELQGPWIIEMSEMASMKKGRIEDVKQFLTVKADRFRAPFAKDTKAHPRRMVFGGSTNQETFVNDTTGGRRFWPIKVGNINLKGLQERRDQLWAEAMHCYKNETREDGTPVWNIPESLYAAAAETQESVRVVSSSEEIVMNILGMTLAQLSDASGGYKYSRCFDTAEKRDFISSAEVCDFMEVPMKDRRHHSWEISEAIKGIMKTPEKAQRRLTDGSKIHGYKVPLEVVERAASREDEETTKDGQNVKSNNDALYQTSEKLDFDPAPL
jgi:predicted P-loop ATPase